MEEDKESQLNTLDGTSIYFTDIVAANMQMLSAKTSLDENKSTVSDNTGDLNEKSQSGKNTFKEDIPF